MKRINWRTAVFTLVLALSAIGVTRMVLADPPVAPRPADSQYAERRLAEATPLPLPAGDWLNGPGVVEPAERESRIGTDVGGVIRRVLVAEAQRVDEGAPLIELSADVERAALDAAESELRALEAELARVQRGNRVEDRRASSAEVDAAEARAASSRAVAERLARAAAGGGATPDEVDRARRQAEADRAELAVLTARRDATLAGSRPEDVLAARARAQGARARRDEASHRLAQRTVRSPLAGEVLQVRVRAGEYAAPGPDALVVVGDTSRMRVRVDVDEREVAKLRVGAEARVRVPAYPRRELPARVESIGRRMGRKNVRSDDPIERNDAKILEVVLSVDAADGLVVGQRVTGFVAFAGR